MTEFNLGNDLEKMQSEGKIGLQKTVESNIEEGNDLETLIKDDDVPYADVLKKIASIPFQGMREPYIKLLAEEKRIKEENILSDLKLIQKDGSQKRKAIKNDTEPTAIFPGLIDIVEHEEKPSFLVLDSDELKIKTQYEHGGIVYEPPPRENFKWLLPRAEEVLKHYKEDTTQNLYYDLITYHESISELPSENHYHLLALWDLHTYLFEKFEYSPYIWFYAIPERGKTRTGKGCIYVAWRGLDIECLREANLLRYAQDLKATLFFDVMDIWKKAERNGTEDILLKRYEKGATVSRVLYPDRGAHKDMKHFEIYGPTIIATNEQVSEILATRAIQIIMPETNKHFENDIKPEMGLPYKERLTAFRAKFINISLPCAEKPTRGRLGDILRPLRQIVMLVCPREEKRFLEMVREIEQERSENLGETIEARIVETLFELKEEFEQGMLEANKLGDELNDGLPDRFKRTQSYYTRKVKSMGLRVTRRGGKTNIIWDENICEKLDQRYLQKSAQTAQSAQLLEDKEKIPCTFDEQKKALLKSAQEVPQKCTRKNEIKTDGCAERAESAVFHSTHNKETEHIPQGKQLDLLKGEI